MDNMIYDEIEGWYHEDDTYKEHELGGREFYLMDKKIILSQIKRIDEIEKKIEELKEEKEEIEEYLRLIEA